MSSYDELFLKNYSFYTYVYIISNIEKQNKKSIETFDNIKPDLYNGKDNFNIQLFDKILNEEFLDNNKLECITMFIDYLLYWTNKNVSVDDNKKRYKFLSYFTNNIDQVITNLNYKNVESAEGFIIFSDFLNLKNKLVIKTPRDDTDVRYLLFEYYIGYNFINKLREKTPNFMYTYGIFMCNQILEKQSIFSNNMVLSKNFCKSNMKKNIYVLFEKIDGVTLHEYIQKITKEEEFDNIVNYILQIILSLDIAQKEGEYVHNDLHTNNVMVRNIPKSFTHKYIIGQNKYSMNIDKIATIIDYGMNRYVENGIPLGTKTLNRLGFNPYKNCTSNDMYKLLMSTVLGIIALCHNNSKIHKQFTNKIDETIEFLVSFFRGKIDYNNVIKSWDIYLKDKNTSKQQIKQNYKEFVSNVRKNMATYFSPYPTDIEFYNTVTPENFIKHVKQGNPALWNKHVTENIINENEIYLSYIKLYNPHFNNQELDDYTFSKNYNDIYMKKYIEQKQIFFRLFNKEFNHYFSKDCLIDQESMILNFNNITDCNNILDLFKSKKSEYDIVENFEKETVKYIKDYYGNDIDTITFYIEQMNNINNSINNILLSKFDNPKLQISMDFFTEDIKKEIKKIHNFIYYFEKYLFLTTCAIELDSVYKKYSNKLQSFKENFDIFSTDMKLFERTLVLSDYLQKYYRIINEFYCTRIVEETSKQITNTYSFYNLCVTLENMYPLLSEYFNKFSKSFVNIKKNLNLVHEYHYVPVNSNLQFFNYIKLGNYQDQIYPLINLITRFVNYQPYNLKQLFNKRDENGNLSDKLIYDELRKQRIIKDTSKKEKRNYKRSTEICDFLSKYGKVSNDRYYHLDFGGNDGSVASEIAKMFKLNKDQIYSADLDKWLGNSKNFTYPNITYTLLGENQKLPYNDNSFDSISCLQVFHHIEFIDYYIRELHRVLKPGGLMIIREHECSETSHQFLIDIEHIIHEYVEPDIPNEDILKSYCAFYKSFNELNSLLEYFGFERLEQQYDFNPKFNPTRYYYSVYRKK